MLNAQHVLVDRVHDERRLHAHARSVRRINTLDLLSNETVRNVRRTGASVPDPVVQVSLHGEKIASKDRVGTEGLKQLCGEQVAGQVGNEWFM